MISQETIALQFRKTELENRIRRRKTLLNELALDNEPLTDFDKRIDEKAKQMLKESTLRREKELRPGYWQRLWAAVRGR